MAMHLMIEQQDTDDKRQQLAHELTGPLRVAGPPIPVEDINAPAWWHGDDEAFEATMAAVGRLPRRR